MKLTNRVVWENVSSDEHAVNVQRGYQNWQFMCRIQLFATPVEMEGLSAEIYPNPRGSFQAGGGRKEGMDDGCLISVNFTGKAARTATEFQRNRPKGTQTTRVIT